MSRARNWCFTLNFGELPPLVFSECDLQDPFSFMCFQEEVAPTTGTHHLQGYFELSRPLTLSALLSTPMFCDLQPSGYSLHFEPRRGSQADAIAYCSKPDSAIAGSFVELGSKKAQGKRSDLLLVKELIDDKRPRDDLWEEAFPAMVRYHKSFVEYARVRTRPRSFKTVVILFVGPSGTGKSRTAFTLASYLSFLFGESRYYVFPEKGSGFWCDDYDQQSVAIIDEMDGNRMTPTQFNTLADRYECVVPCHGSAGHQFNARFLIVTSNYLPKYWWKKRSPDQVIQTTRRIDVLVPFLRLPLPPVIQQHPFFASYSRNLRFDF